MLQSFYKDFLFKKQRPKSDILEGLLELNEHKLTTANDINSLYNVSIPTQEEVWICGRIYNENASGGGGGKLSDHNIIIQGSYVCSNSHSIPMSLANCSEYSLFPGQIVLAKGRNPDGKRFQCSEIIEPSFVANTIKNEIKDESDSSSISVKLGPGEDLVTIVASGPYMKNGTIEIDQLELLIDVVKAKNAHVLILLGPFVDINNDLIVSGDIQLTFDELLQTIFDKLSILLNDSKVQVILQPSLKDITQEPIYPIRPFNASQQFIKQNENFHFLPEPSIIKINGVVFAITTTDIIKDLTMMSTAKTTSSDKISRNFSHIMRQRSFYPIYPPPESVCIDFEAWHTHARIEVPPRVFISASDMANFNKEVNNCTCFNPGKLVKGTSNGTYAKIIVSDKPIVVEAIKQPLVVPAINLNANKSSILDEYQQMAVAQEVVQEVVSGKSYEAISDSNICDFVSVSIHKI